MCKTNEKTRQYYFFTEGQNVLQKTYDELNIDFGRQKTKPNTTLFYSCTITANI